MASVNARAQEYEDSGAFGDTPMDVLRAYAYLDLLNGHPGRDPDRLRRGAGRGRRGRRGPGLGRGTRQPAPPNEATGPDRGRR